MVLKPEPTRSYTGMLGQNITIKTSGLICSNKGCSVLHNLLACNCCDKAYCKSHLERHNYSKKITKLSR